MTDLTATLTIHRLKLPPIGEHKGRIGWRPELTLQRGDETRTHMSRVYAYKRDAEFYGQRLLDSADLDLWEAI